MKTKAKVKKNGNKQLNRAKKSKNDEFYTRIEDIELELCHYTQHFNGKIIYMNADDPTVSNFFRYFTLKFNDLGLKKVIATCYKNRDIDLFSQNNDEHAIAIIYEGTKNSTGIPNKSDFKTIELQGDGDFRSEESIAFLKEADIVVTNPPFSLFRSYIAQLYEYNKKFIIIGSMNAITYKEIFPLIMENKLWLGINNGTKTYIVPDGYELKNSFIGTDGKKYITMGNTCWYTNLDHGYRHRKLELMSMQTNLKLNTRIINNKYAYRKYDNYDAIEVPYVSAIPSDYDGIMGVPISFLDKYNPEQFEILGLDDHRIKPPNWRGRGPEINGKSVYRRIIIKHKKQTKGDNDENNGKENQN